MGSTKIIDLPGYELSKHIHEKKVSCKEVMGEYLDHIEKVNPRVNAIVALQDRDDLMQQAENRDEQLSRGDSCGWMHGFPSAIKDLQETKGIVTTMGSPIYKDNVPEKDSLMVSRMKSKGSIIIGKTNVPEWGFGSQSYNPVYGATGNPYDQSKTCGGSSGGAACSLAMHMQPVADGSDSMGSLRNPAGFCNVFGYRPSFGRVPKMGLEVFTNMLGTQGPMGRTVADIALLLGTQSGYDPRSPLSKGDDPRIKELTPYNVFDKLKSDVSGAKVAWLGDWGGHLAMEKGVLETVEQTLKTFPSFGVSVEPIKPFYDPLEFWEKIWIPIRHYSACDKKPLIDKGYRDLIKPEAQWEVDGAAKLSAIDVYKAFEKRTEFYLAMLKVFDTYDYIVVPTAQVFPFDKTIHWPKEIEGRKMKTYHNWMEVVAHWTMGCNAVMAAPAGFGGKDNMPIGMQIVAKPGNDFELLQFAKAYEEVNDFVGRYPARELV